MILKEKVTLTILQKLLQDIDYFLINSAPHIRHLGVVATAGYGKIKADLAPIDSFMCAASVFAKSEIRAECLAMRPLYETLLRSRNSYGKYKWEEEIKIFIEAILNARIQQMHIDESIRIEIILADHNTEAISQIETLFFDSGLAPNKLFQNLNYSRFVLGRFSDVFKWSETKKRQTIIHPKTTIVQNCSQ